MEEKPVGLATKDAGEEARREAARLMGLARTERKAASSRKNGQAGGRPKGSPMSEDAKARISAANRARWAAKKATKETPAPEESAQE